MFENLEMLRMARALTGHAAERQAMVARNIANSDTPGFKARELEDFASRYRNDAPALRQTRPGHIAGTGWRPAARQTLSETGLSPNGNSVSLENEMVKLAETRREHELSIGIYRSALNMMRSSIGRRN